MGTGKVAGCFQLPAPWKILRLFARQHDAKAAQAVLARGRDLPSVGRNHLHHDVETQAESPRPHVLRWLHAETARRAPAVRRQGISPPFVTSRLTLSGALPSRSRDRRDRAQSVTEGVPSRFEHLTEARAIPTAAQISTLLELDPLGGRSCKLVQGTLGDLLQTDPALSDQGNAAALSSPCQIEEIVDHAGHALAAAHDAVEYLQLRITLAGHLELCRAEHHIVEWRSQIVTHGGHEALVHDQRLGQLAVELLDALDVLLELEPLPMEGHEGVHLVFRILGRWA